MASVNISAASSLCTEDVTTSDEPSSPKKEEIDATYISAVNARKTKMKYLRQREDEEKKIQENILQDYKKSCIDLTYLEKHHYSFFQIKDVLEEAIKAKDLKTAEDISVYYYPEMKSFIFQSLRDCSHDGGFLYETFHSNAGDAVAYNIDEHNKIVAAFVCGFFNNDIREERRIERDDKNEDPAHLGDQFHYD